MKVPSVLALWFLAPWLAASPMDDVKRLLEEDVSPSQRPNIAAKINGILALEVRGDLDIAEQIEAARIAGDYRLLECLPLLLKKVVRLAPVLDREESLERMYPCVGAIVGMGERVVPRLLVAIGEAERDAEGDAEGQLKGKLLRYALMRIDSKAKALKLWMLQGNVLWC